MDDSNLPFFQVIGRPLAITDFMILVTIRMKVLSEKDPHNKSILNQISGDEPKHYHFWKDYTRQDAKPKKLSLWKYYLISRIFGITFE
jgi:hypothetical protein